ncbi:MAG: aldehyde dehydrogenase family protein, partial [Caldilinea sp.]
MNTLFAKLNLKAMNPGGCSGQDRWITSAAAPITSFNPTTGEAIAQVIPVDATAYDAVVADAQHAFLAWRSVPAPKRGELIRDLGAILREYREPLGELVSLEMGKIRAEGIGEVQEMIDICDFAVGLSRQLYGLTMHSERPAHRMYEQWHPLGPIGIITAFNFPVAVWSWNAAIAAVCGDTMVWKPSELVPLCGVAVQHLANRVMADHGLSGVFTLAVGAGRLGRPLLELGGNNAIIVSDKADLDLATRAIVFGAVGTAGQRCTSTRRIIAHETIVDELTARLVKAYQQVRIGDPLQSGTLMGPLATARAVESMLRAIDRAVADGGQVLTGGKARPDIGAQFVEPTIIRMPAQTEIVCEETFAPILYVMSYRTLEEAIELHNGVTQGLSSAIFTDSLREAEHFLSVA